jgi:hypothetical protein
LIGQSGHWSRYRLSRELASLWNWRTPQGQLNDMAARTLLLKLQEQGWVRLPEPRIKSPTRSGRAPAAVTSALDESPLESVLPELVPLRLHEVSRADRREPRRQLEAALHQPHYLKQLTRFKSLTRPSPPTVSETVSYPPQPPLLDLSCHPTTTKLSNMRTKNPKH